MPDPFEPVGPMATRRELIKAAAGTVASALLATGCGDENVTTPDTGGSEPVQRRPNVLLMIMDEMRIAPDGYIHQDDPTPDECSQMPEHWGETSQLPLDW